MKRLYLLLTLMFVCCEEYYEPNIEKQETAYVFDALITDQPGPYHIRITKTNGYSNDTMDVIEDAYVGVKCNDGNYYPFSYGGNGYYYSDSSQFLGITGKSYQMQVTIDKSYFTSEWEDLLPCPDIESLSADYYETNKITTNGSAYIDEVDYGILVMNTTNTDGYTPYYRYECDFITQIHQHYPGIIPPENRYIYRPYYANGQLFLADASKYENKRIVNNQLLTTPHILFELRNDTIIPGLDFELQHYGEYVLVKQFSLSEKQYNYWNTIMEQHNNVNYLFGQIEKQPVSNINCSSNLISLGFFCVSSVSKKCGSFSFSPRQKTTYNYDYGYFPYTDTMAIYDLPQDFTIFFHN